MYNVRTPPVNGDTHLQFAGKIKQKRFKLKELVATLEENAKAKNINQKEHFIFTLMHSSGRN